MTEDTKSLRVKGFPIWDWISRHHPLDDSAVISLLRDESPNYYSLKTTVTKPIDEFISFLRKFGGGCLCIKTNCLGCYHSGQDVLLFVHKLSEYFRINANASMPPDELVFKLISLSKECRVRQTCTQL
jgi:hypothetical protein